MENPGTGGSDGVGGLTFGPMAGALSFAGANAAGKGGGAATPMLSSGQSFPDPGCACRAAGQAGSWSLAWLALGAFGLAQLRRRRRS
jgi:MYXO-CTERM domain-containing protein